MEKKTKMSLNILILISFITSLSLFPILIKGEQISTYIIPVLAILWILNLLINGSKIRLNSVGLIGFFLVLHLISYYLSSDSNKALIIILKVLVCLVAFVIFSNIQIFWRNKYDFNKMSNIFINTLIISGGIITSLLIYIYIIKFRSDYISININYPSQAGRNQLALFLLALSPFSISKLLERQVTHVNIILKVFSIIILIGFVLTMSRGAWLSLIFAVIIVSIFRNNFKTIIMLFLCIALIAYFSPSNVIDRWDTIIQMFTADHDISYGGSSAQIRQALNRLSIDRIIANPLMGIGLGNYSLITNNAGFNNISVSHNDYLQMATEMGILAPLIFLIFLIRMMLNLNRISKRIDKKYENINQSLLVFIVSVVIYLAFINAYFTLLLWVLFGFVNHFCNEMKMDIMQGNNES